MVRVEARCREEDNDNGEECGSDISNGFHPPAAMESNDVGVAAASKPQQDPTRSRAPSDSDATSMSSLRNLSTDDDPPASPQQATNHSRYSSLELDDQRASSPRKKLTAAGRAAQRREERRARKLAEAAADAPSHDSTTTSNDQEDSKPAFLEESALQVSDIMTALETPASIDHRGTTIDHSPRSRKDNDAGSDAMPTGRRRFQDRFARTSGTGPSARPARTRSGPEQRTSLQPRPADTLRMSLPPSTFAAPGDDLVAARATPTATSAAAAAGDAMAATPRSITSRARRPTSNSDQKTANPGPEAYANNSTCSSSASTSTSNAADAIAAAAAAGLGIADYSQKQRERRIGHPSHDSATAADASIDSSLNNSNTSDQSGLSSYMIRPGAYKEIPGRGLIRNDTLRFNLMEQVRESFRIRKPKDGDWSEYSASPCGSPRASMGIHDFRGSKAAALSIPSVLVEEDEPRNLDAERNNNSWTAGESQRYLRDPSILLPHARPIFLLTDDEESKILEQQQQQSPAAAARLSANGSRRFHVPNPDRSCRARIPIAGDASRRSIVATAQVTPVDSNDVVYDTLNAFCSEYSDVSSDFVVDAVSATPMLEDSSNHNHHHNHHNKRHGKTMAALSMLRKKLGPKGLANLFRKRGKRKTPARSKSSVPESMKFEAPPPTPEELRSSQRRHSF